jgi:hypothetical protein
MKLHRRHFFSLAAGAAALLALSRVASALDYPTRPRRRGYCIHRSPTPTLLIQAETLCAL